MERVDSQLPLSPGGYDVDLPCAGCGYNLRGLESDGYCPECGHSNWQSVAIWRRRLLNEPTPMTDAAWVDVLADGVFLALIGFALIVVLAVAPAWMFQWRSSHREVMLGIACTALTVCWYGAWKLTRSDPSQVERTHERLLRILCRWNATIFFAPLFLTALPNEIFISEAVQYLELPLIVIYFTGALTAGAGYYCQCLSLARRAGAPILIAVALVLAVANFFIFLSPLLPELGGGNADSLSGVMNMPTCAFGAADTLRDAIALLSYPLRSSILSVLVLCVFVAFGGFHIALWWRLRHIARAIRMTSATEPEVPPSSPP